MNREQGGEAMSIKSMKSVVTIAGSDSSGGAGIQADLKTMTALGVFGQSAITALTAQNTMGVLGVEETTPDFLALQIKAIFEDIRPDAVKVGMVANPALIKTIAESLRMFEAQNIVLDPVMIATSGASLASDDVAQALVDDLFSLATVVTPNLSEAEVFSGFAIEKPQDMVNAAHAIRDLGARAVLVKGGHLENTESTEKGDVFEPGHAYDLLLAEDGTEFWLREPRIETKNTHGTGCTLSSAIACYLAQGCELVDAVKRAKYYLTQALAHDLQLGKGNGPVNHIWHLDTTVS
ncbi:bifunctional hydroxymethylpyrimidine kinase/phosphomethylpyrimidine kinase [Anaerotardibacter muris]|uniref:bifunctional hydroxymethylpyrimidine kinase/phosphomethylpyrimidine kinase n=1 Tax=Anaerotardibacter muris TaxID=2941505 RepID=UPI0030841564